MSYSQHSFQPGPPGHPPPPYHQAAPGWYAQPSYPSHPGNWSQQPIPPQPAYIGSYPSYPAYLPATAPMYPMPPPQAQRANSDFASLGQAANQALGGKASQQNYGNDVTKFSSTQLAADAHLQMQQQINPSLTKEQRMYMATVRELTKIVEAKYRGQLTNKRGNPEAVAFLIHRHCEAMRMMGKVAEEIIQTTNAFMEEACFDLDQMYQRLGGGDYWCMKEAIDFVKGLIMVFQKGGCYPFAPQRWSDPHAESIGIFFPNYLSNLYQQQLAQQQQYAQEQQPDRRRQASGGGGCTIM